MTKATILKDRIARYMFGGAVIGGKTNKVTIGTDGSITLSGSGRPTHHVFVPPSAFYITGASVSRTSLNSRWDSLHFMPSDSASDVTVYGQALVPEDADVTYGITPKVLWSRGAAGTASGIADWEVDIESVASGEATGTASTADVTNGASYTGASANIIWSSTLDTVGANVIAVGDVLSLELRLKGSDGKTTAGCPYFLGLELEYKAARL